jgi:signal peptidase I
VIRAAQAASAAFDGNRLVAFSGFLKQGSREFETVVRGGSMGPALPNGSGIRVRFASDSEYVKGAVVAYVAHDRIIAHRIVHRIVSHGKAYLLTRGDSTVLCDSPVSVSVVVGLVTHFASDGEWLPVAPLALRPLAFRFRATFIAWTIAAIARFSPRAAQLLALRLIALRAMLSKRLPVRSAPQVGGL